ncbi:MAG: ankyrin repeat domain-containing protein [Parachlamydiaceae bacterium]|nr:ankyrin repeat domain-containing protein [Parachlamydiaceae bacterium]
MAFFKSFLNLKTYDSELTALFIACREKNIGIVKSLIKNEADLNATNRFGDTALGECISSAEFPPSTKDNEIFNALLEAGSNVNQGVDMHDNHAIMACLAKKNLDWAWKLLPASDLNRQNNFKQKIIHRAVAMGARTMVIELAKNKDAISFINSFSIEAFHGIQITPCYLAVQKDYPLILDILLKAGGDPYLRSINPYFRNWSEAEPLSPFLLAADLKRFECLEVIVKRSPPKPLDYKMGFDRNVLTVSNFDSKSSTGFFSLPSVAEASVCKIKSAVTAIDTINFFVETNASDEIKQIFKKYFTNPELGEAANLYLPIWKAVCAYAKSNEFSIIFSSEKENHCGRYNSDTKSEIFIYLKNLHGDEAGGTFIHEMAHKCEDLIYQTSNLVPSDSESPFYHAVETDIKNLPSSTNLFAPILKKIFLTVPTHYPENQHAAEYLVRVPQAILMLIHTYKLNHEQVVECMNESLPNLFAFYQNDFLPNCERYSANHS